MAVATVTAMFNMALAADAPGTINIPAQSLAESLEALSSQSHVQMLYSADLVRGLSAQAVIGEFTAEEALHRLLQGSGLVFETTGDRAYAIVKFGSDADAATGLDVITVTATRTRNSAFEVPASVSTLTRDQLDDAQAKDVGSVISNLPGVTMDSSPRVTGQLPTLRGYQGPDIILRVDDARRSLDTSVGLMTPLFVDPNFVKQIDVVRGPSSAAYGGGGMGGVLAFQTLGAEDVVAEGDTFGGWIKTDLRSGDYSRSGNVTAAGRSQDVSVLASGTLKDYGKIHTGADTGQEEYAIQDGLLKNVLLKAGYDANDLNKFQLGYMRYSNVGFEPTNPNSNPYATTGFQHKERIQTDVTGNWTFRDADRSLFDGKVSAYHTTLGYNNEKRSSTASTALFKVDTWGGSGQNSSRFEALDVGHRLTYGVDGYRDNLHNLNNGSAAAVNPDGTMRALGGFLQDEVQINPDWTAIATLRQDSYVAHASGFSDNTNSRVSPKFTVKWQALEPLGIFVGYGEAFRAPTLTELYMNLTGTGSFSNFRSNSVLRPQTSRGREAGVTLSFDEVLADKDALRIKATAFAETVDDLITQKTVGTYARTAPFSGTGSIFQYQNVSKARRWGGDAEMNYRVNDLDFNLGYSQIRVKDNATGENLFAPPDKYTFGVGYDLNEYVTLRYMGKAVEVQDYDTTTSRQRSGYAVHDVGATYEQDWYRVDFGITNLFDKAYATYHQSLATSYVYQEGRSYNLSLTARF